MGVKVLLTIRTANRCPKQNYLLQTVRNLRAQGVSSYDIHVFPTSPADAEWAKSEVWGLASVYATHTRRTPNMNGLAPIALLDEIDADWIILSEDDLEWCADPVGSMARWLEKFAHPDVLVYRFFAFDKFESRVAVASVPLREQKGSQVIALRAADARRLADWAMAHPLDWRPKGAPFQDQPHNGFDKLVGYWALQDRPAVTHGLVSRPFFVKHLGVQSSLHSHGIRRDAEFIGSSVAYAGGA